MANETRELLLEKAFELFMEKGYEGTTFRDMVESSHLSKGAFYHYFKKKEHIYMAIIEKQFLSHLPKPVSFDKNIKNRDLQEDFEILWRPYALLLEELEKKYGHLSKYFRFLHESILFDNKVQVTIRKRIDHLGEYIEELIDYHFIHLQSNKKEISLIILSMIEGLGIILPLNHKGSFQIHFEETVDNLLNLLIMLSPK